MNFVVFKVTLDTGVRLEHHLGQVSRMKKVIWGIDGGNFVQISRSYIEGVHILGQNIFSGVIFGGVEIEEGYF